MYSHKMSFEIVSETTKTSKKFHSARRSVCFKLSAIPEDVVDAEQWVKNGIMDIVAHIVEDVEPEDRVGFVFESEGFLKGQAYLPFKKAKNVTFEDIWGLLGKIYQSNSKGFHADTFRMTMTQVKAKQNQPE